jgi:hypothetical protein
MDLTRYQLKKAQLGGHGRLDSLAALRIEQDEQLDPLNAFEHASLLLAAHVAAYKQEAIPTLPERVLTRWLEDQELNSGRELENALILFELAKLKVAECASGFRAPAKLQ